MHFSKYLLKSSLLQNVNLTLLCFQLLFISGEGHSDNPRVISREGSFLSRNNIKKSDDASIKRLNSISTNVNIKTAHEDIVGYGEDCSKEGPFCNEALHLTCDLIDETCICDFKGGYVHVDKVEGVLNTGKNVCIRPDFQNDLEKVPRSTSDLSKRGKQTLGSKQQDVFIVGFGEDCSLEDDLICDKAQHLVCEPEEEICICDIVGGYINVNELPEGADSYWELVETVKGVVIEEHKRKPCASVGEFQKMTEKRSVMLLGLANENQYNSILDRDPDDPNGFEVDLNHGEGEENLNNEWVSPDDVDNEGMREPENKIALDFYKEYMASLEPTLTDEEARLKRLEPFKLKINQYDYKTLSFKDLIIEELLKYGKDLWNFKDRKETLKDYLKAFYDPWHNSQIATVLCSLVFDVDGDDIATYQEYVMVILSEKIRKLVIPKVFPNLITTSTDDNCIRIEDLRKLNHNRKMIEKDFNSIDINLDGCISLSEFEKMAMNICNANWLYLVLQSTGADSVMKYLDPSPEEMYIRRLMQKERMKSNWKIVDNDGDGLISRTELQSDLISMGLATEESYEETEALLKIMDYGKDEFISIEEATITISLPELTDDYQVEWLESLFELYETDEDEVSEYLDVLLKNFEDFESNELDEARKEELGLFYIFDKNRDGVMDMTELRLLLEMIKKYVIFESVNDIIKAIDFDGDSKATVFEYNGFFKASSDSFQIESKIMLTSLMDDESEINDDDDETVALVKLYSKAMKTNETVLVKMFFDILDENKDNLITKNDLYQIYTSPNMHKSDSELEHEFQSLDVDKDGKITSKDSTEFALPIDLETYKQLSQSTEEVSFKNFLISFILMDSNFDGVIQKDEFITGKKSLLDEEEAKVLNWIELHFIESPPQMGWGGEDTFKEFDEDMDGFISETEFSNKLIRVSEESYSLNIESRFKSSADDLSKYFRNMDLNKDKKVSYNEFSFLLLRKHNLIDEK